MLDILMLDFALVAKLVFPGWLIGACVFLSLVIGIVIGFFYWIQARIYSQWIDDSTRGIQSQYDLVSRDVTKARQDSRKFMSS